MQTKLIALFTAILALARTPKDEEDSIEAQKAHIQSIRDEIDTIHGDEDFNSEEVSILLNDLITVVSTSEPDPDYAEVPEVPEVPEAEEAADDTDTEEAPDADGEEGDPGTEEEAETTEGEEEPAPAETPRQRRLRIAEEEEAAAAKAAAAKKKPASTIKRRH